MPESARERILARLRLRTAPPAPACGFDVMACRTWPPEERYGRLRRLMEESRAEFLEATEESWPGVVHRFLVAEGLATILYGTDTPAGRRLAESWPAGPGPRLVAYDRPVEEMKRELFERIDAGFTATRGGIADTGGLILWPSPAEPRLLSLVPPVHVALLDTRAIHDSFWHAVREGVWAGAMPPNALLISGPSKTADIEQTLAYGVHGPRRLVVVAVRPVEQGPDPPA
jgi:L-lactate dehydrogenase complex protein LldG